MRFLRILFVLSLLVPVPSRATIIVSDDLGRKVILSHPAKRIISLSPHITETLFAIGAGKSLIATVEGSDYPREATHLPLVGNSISMNIEKIIALRPDLVIAWMPNKALETHLRSKRIPIFYSDPKSISALLNGIKTLGTLSNQSNQASQVVTQLAQRISLLKQTQRPATSVFYEVSTQPLYTLGKGSLINEGLHLCGAVNIFETVPQKAPIISLEKIIQLNPDVIISQSKNTVQTYWRPLKNSLKAVKNNRVYIINPDVLTRPGPRFIEGVETLCKLISPSGH